MELKENTWYKTRNDWDCFVGLRNPYAKDNQNCFLGYMKSDKAPMSWNLNGNYLSSGQECEYDLIEEMPNPNPVSEKSEKEAIDLNYLLENLDKYHWYLSQTIAWLQGFRSAWSNDSQGIPCIDTLHSLNITLKMILQEKARLK